MKKEKGFILHEMRTLRWFLLIGILIVVWCCFYLHSETEMFLSMGNYQEGVLDLYYDNSMIPGNYFSEALSELLNYGHCAIVVLFAVLTAIQFSDVHKRKNQEYMSSLPFTNGKRMMIKVTLGLAIITGLCVLFGIGTVIVREANIADVERAMALTPCFQELLATETIWHTLRTLMLFWITLLAVYLVYAFVHCLVENAILASLMGMGVMIAPVQIVWFLQQISNMYFQSGKSWFDISEQARRYGAIFFGGDVSTESMLIYSTEMHMDEYVHLVKCRETSEWLITIGVLVLCIIGCTLAIYRVSKKRDLAKAGKLIPLAWARILFSVGVSICVTTTLVAIFAMPERLPVLGVILLVVCSALFFALMKVFKVSVK